MHNTTPRMGHRLKKPDKLGAQGLHVSLPTLLKSQTVLAHHVLDESVHSFVVGVVVAGDIQRIVCRLRRQAYQRHVVVADSVNPLRVVEGRRTAPCAQSRRLGRPPHRNARTRRKQGLAVADGVCEVFVYKSHHLQMSRGNIWPGRDYLKLGSPMKSACTLLFSAMVILKQTLV